MDVNSPKISKQESAYTKSSPNDFEKKIREQRKKEIMQRIQELNSKIQPTVKSPSRINLDYSGLLQSQI